MATEMGRMPFFYNQEGRLVQVDYALQAVSRGSTTIGLKTKDFALLSSQVKPTRPLMEPAEKVFVVDDHVGATGSGYIGDVTTLLDQLRVAAQRHRLVYDEPIDLVTPAIEGVNGGKTQIEHGFVTAPGKRFEHRPNGTNAG